MSKEQSDTELIAEEKAILRKIAQLELKIRRKRCARIGRHIEYRKAKGETYRSIQEELGLSNHKFRQSRRWFIYYTATGEI
ncbi:hypothetical protein KAR91_62250 [Candidatus Pacearchaeota archaeon]|nr:hypothetical protein [Candidatus Pacearchaeota archaeon]